MAIRARHRFRRLVLDGDPQAKRVELFGWAKVKNLRRLSGLGVVRLFGLFCFQWSVGL
jgi:hypothetical protein